MARRQSAVSSLELLLDTITNTFGSVLFLTILVTLLLRTAGDGAADSEPGEPPMTATDQALLEARIADAAQDCDRLQARLATIAPVEPGLVALQATVVERASEAVRALADVAATDGLTLEHQRRAVAADAERQAIDQALSEIKPQAEKESERRKVLEEEAAALARLAVDLDRPVDSAKIEQTVVLPVLGATDKKQIGLYLRYGRLYVMHRWTDAGERLGPNPDHFLVVSKPDGTQAATARPDAGFIADATTVRPEIARILRSFPADRWAVGLVVYEDSFSQFQAVKAALVELGYQYVPIRSGPGDPIRDRGGGSRAQ